MERSSDASKTVVRTVFISLVLDLLAFTIPLPLFPRLIAWYLHNEAHSPDTLLAQLLNGARTWRSVLLSASDRAPRVEVGGEARWLQSGGRDVGGSKNWDVVLLGGAMGSLFSLCQCIISPWLGQLSDKYGRKRVLLLTMLGNILSAVIWLRSASFSTFLVSRLVGGLSEGNVQLSTAIISDVTNASSRSRSLALVGIAFSICFTLGPSLGAYFASQPIPLTSTKPTEGKWNIYAAPAGISLVLLCAETLYLAISLPETRGWQKADAKTVGAEAMEKNAVAQESSEQRLARLSAVGRLHGLFLLFFSGAEFTLTFLTYDLFAASNAQNGRLLSFIGILAALLQARHVRPSLSRLGELRLASFGMLSSVIALVLLAALPSDAIRSSNALATAMLYGAATALAYTSATVVTGLTAAAAGCCDEGVEVLKRGRALGGFRSKGQLGRAVGPLLASSVYWVRGPTTCYATIGICMVGVWLFARGQAEEERMRRKAGTGNTE